MRTTGYKTVVVVVALIEMFGGGGCGGSGSAPIDTVSHAVAAPPETPAALKRRLHRQWTAPGAAHIPSDAGPTARSPRMRVADRLMSELVPPRTIVDRVTARAVLGKPDRVSAAGDVWFYVISRRRPDDAPGDFCGRTFEVRFTPSGKQRAMVENGEECASDNRPFNGSG